MKAYLTTIGERTTDICCQQLKRYGFDVIIVGGKESWFNKYCRFIEMAEGDCMRIDADIIPNKDIRKVGTNCGDALMSQYKYFDFYKNKISIGCPLFYKKEALDIINVNLGKLSQTRPETAAWRLPEIVERTFTSDIIVGMHGFGADEEMMERAKRNKTERGQMEEYDFDLAYKILKLYR